MSHSFIEYENRNLRLHDLDVWMIRQCLIRYSNDSELKLFASNMDWCGPGVILGCDFTDYVAGNGERLSILVNVLRVALAELSLFGDVIPESYIKANIDPEGQYFNSEQESQPYIAAISSLIELLS